MQFTLDIRLASISDVGAIIPAKSLRASAENG
jgi:hypothetical protein